MINPVIPGGNKRPYAVNAPVEWFYHSHMPFLKKKNYQKKPNENSFMPEI